MEMVGKPVWIYDIRQKETKKKIGIKVPGSVWWDWRHIKQSLQLYLSLSANETNVHLTSQQLKRKFNVTESLDSEHYDNRTKKSLTQ